MDDIFSFPYEKAYESQFEMMNFIYSNILKIDKLGPDRKKLLLIESPTGTVSKLYIWRKEFFPVAHDFLREKVQDFTLSFVKEINLHLF